MRQLVFLFAPALAAFVVPAAANDSSSVSCRTEAANAADEWLAARVERAAANEEATSSAVVVIAYGHKYVTANQEVDPETLNVRRVGTLAAQRNEVYHEELDRCLGHFTVKVVGTVPLEFQRVTKKRPGTR